MSVNGMQCQSCHGDLLAVAGFTSQLGQPGFVDPYLPNVNDPSFVVTLTTTNAQRRPWVDLPKCQSCHTGDALNHTGSDIIGRQAYENADTASPILASTSRFAENQSLYRFSQTHGGVACESCHGSTHAEWPARVNTNDNVTAMQLQGHTGEIAECGVCHNQELAPSLKGPHGLHNINSPVWMKAHGGFKIKDPAACQACHGKDFKGTVLSRAKADRVLTQKGNQPISIAKGTPINCYDCHSTIR
jgi:hypothetical protein